MSVSRVRMEPVPMHRDPRGSVLEPLAADELPAQANVHVAITEPGHVRGNHYHERATEVLVVYGPALVRVREEGELRDTEVPAGEAYRFVIPPGVPHAIRHSGDHPGVAISFSTELHDRSAPDVVRVELI